MLNVNFKGTPMTWQDIKMLKPTDKIKTDEDDVQNEFDIKAKEAELEQLNCAIKNLADEIQEWEKMVNKSINSNKNTDGTLNGFMMINYLITEKHKLEEKAMELSAEIIEYKYEHNVN